MVNEQMACWPVIIMTFGCGRRRPFKSYCTSRWQVSWDLYNQFWLGRSIYSRQFVCQSCLELGSKTILGLLRDSMNLPLCAQYLRKCCRIYETFVGEVVSDGFGTLYWWSEDIWGNISLFLVHGLRQAIRSLSVATSVGWWFCSTFDEWRWHVLRCVLCWLSADFVVVFYCKEMVEETDVAYCCSLVWCRWTTGMFAFGVFVFDRGCDCLVL